MRAERAAYTVSGRGDDFVTDVIHFLANRIAAHAATFRTVNPTLEDVFLKLTGHGDPGLRPMLRGLWKLTWVEIKIFVREPLGVIGSVGVPVVLFVVLRPIARQPRPGGRSASRRCSVQQLPIFAALLIALSAVAVAVAVISIYREGGILKRLRATPLRPVDDPRRARAREAGRSRPSRSP